MISYRSANEWAHRFGRKKSSKDKITQNTFGIENTGFEFEIESYLEHLAINFKMCLMLTVIYIFQDL